MPGPMVLFPNKKFTLVFSTSNNAIGLVNNVTQNSCKAPMGARRAISLPGFSESIVVAPDNATGFAAVPTAPVTGQAPGVVDVLDFSYGCHYCHNSGSWRPFPGAEPQRKPGSGAGRKPEYGHGPHPQFDRHQCAIPAIDVQSPLFDHPVWGVFSSDDSTAYILNCGPGVRRNNGQRHALRYKQQLARAHHSSGRRNHRPACRQHPLRCRHKAGGTLAPVPPLPTLATTCGEVSAVDLAAMTVSSTATITDGYHNQIALGANNQLFIGARTCTNINSSRQRQ